MATPTPSFESEALPHLDTLYRVALRLTTNPAAAEDLVQDTMLRALRAWGSFRPGSNARAWLVTILRNQFITGWRSARRGAQPVDVEAIPELPDLADPDPEGRFFAELVDDEVLAALDQLPEEFREVADIIAETLISGQSAAIDSLRARVKALADRFPLYEGL